jgi:probable F420-dependent oxidoreductase
MRFSLWLWPYDRWGDIDSMLRAARRAEELGFHSVSVSDHIICPRGPIGDGVTPMWPDWSVLATALACTTTRLRIVSCLVVPYRHPVSVAKQIASIDQLSGGRFTLAAASGWLQTEFEMLRIPHAERGEITDDYLRAMRVLWTESNPSYHGRYVEFDDIIFEPRCVQSPHVPIWIAGGWAPKPRRRVIALGDGWMPMGGDLDSGLAQQVVQMKEDAVHAGLDPDRLQFRYTIGIGRAEEALSAISSNIGVAQPTAVGSLESADDVAAAVQRYEVAGFTELALNFSARTRDECFEQLEWFGCEVLPLLGGKALAAPN